MPWRWWSRCEFDGVDRIPARQFQFKAGLPGRKGKPLISTCAFPFELRPRHKGECVEIRSSDPHILHVYGLFGAICLSGAVLFAYIGVWPLVALAFGLVAFSVYIIMRARRSHQVLAVHEDTVSLKRRGDTAASCAIGALTIELRPVEVDAGARAYYTWRGFAAIATLGNEWIVLACQKRIDRVQDYLDSVRRTHGLAFAVLEIDEPAKFWGSPRLF